MIEGKQIIGFELKAGGDVLWQSTNPATGEKIADFRSATPAEIEEAATKAASAFLVYRKKSGFEKADFLDAIAGEMSAISDELLAICMAETALLKVNLTIELNRTINQLKMFGNLLREGSWLDARIETAEPERLPRPKPDVRFMHIGLGPVLVFGSSNFPFAFSTAGGDTASALAAGCPVIVKAHPAHPATGHMVAQAILRAAQKTGVPDGVFSHLFDNGLSVAQALVVHPAIKAVGFTGSTKGGKALYDMAVRRDEPIPVYAEMGSSNPVFVLPEIAKNEAENFAKGFASSVSVSVGQLCTNPGILLYEKSQASEGFTNKLQQEFQQTVGGVMLAPNIANAYNTGVEHRAAHPGVEVISKGQTTEGLNVGAPVLFKTDSTAFMADATLAEEIFGPESIVVEANSKEEIFNIARNLHGHLTATIHGTPADLEAYRELIDILELKVGRIIINGFPTGVDVSSAMVHGGPFPATSDSRATSVGTAAIFRFTRPVAYQNMPDALLPEELQNANPLNIWRRINGAMDQGKVE
ncbi:aldehyde dehydrogenase (NADP(+)) [Mucilaginibacter auburnensis]|uniref:NADP-dependent aldehyde dehydrogenase n=1 Tax=Mucilaginibacter auburnensis TaxID=1457233 RepID=A0A2H9VQQ9_9SPHI|nr:aldehyde dehydrogenase (NADP(+)) [Mucilaginibacter auburnensis]PJJ83144.1 NADP-dependent aldehyde dehydrogenase [Mucilaginibacter auburnensis]